MKDKTSKVTVVLIFLSVVTLALILFRLVQTVVPGGDTPPRAEAAPPAGTAPGTARQSGQDGRGNPRSGSAQGVSPQGGGGSAGGNTGGAQPGTAIRVTPVALGTVENSVIISGDVLSSSQVSIYPAMPGKLTELRVRPGDRVGRGQVIALVDPSRPGDPFYANPVTSTVSGVVLSAPVNVGETLQTGTAICVVGNLSDLQVETYV
ncbi:MAG: biotin/lipoyl-binding protein, partial [Treponema sp.]|nr:biotin/lipoyl-binding protein [Treponema sp.]